MSNIHVLQTRGKMRRVGKPCGETIYCLYENICRKFQWFLKFVTV